MNLVDSCGWLEYFGDLPNAPFFSAPIQDAAHLIVPTICIAEVFKRLLNQRGKFQALQAAMEMRMGVVVDLDTELAVEAARLSLEHKLPLADSIILATARLHQAVIWTQDAHFRPFPKVKFKVAPPRSKLH